MAYVVFKHNQEYGPRKGLEGPFHYPNGRVAYYDPKDGRYLGSPYRLLLGNRRSR